MTTDDALYLACVALGYQRISADLSPEEWRENEEAQQIILAALNGVKELGLE